MTAQRLSQLNASQQTPELFSELPVELQMIILKRAAEAESYGPPAYMLLYQMAFHVYGHRHKPEHRTPAGLERLVRNGGLYVPHGHRGMMSTSHLARFLTLEAWLRAVRMTNVKMAVRPGGTTWDMDDIKAKALEILEEKVKEAKQWLDAAG